MSSVAMSRGPAVCCVQGQLILLLGYCSILTDGDACSRSLVEK